VTRVYILLAVLLALAPTAWAEPASARVASPPLLNSQEFAERATAASQFAIAASEILLKRSVDRKIRKFAEQIVEDYRTGTIYISEAAAASNIRLPDRLPSDLQQRLAMLENASPNDIDTLFMRELSQMHGDAIPLFTAYAESGDNRSLRFLAGRALPTLREHYASSLQLAAR